MNTNKRMPQYQHPRSRLQGPYSRLVSGLQRQLILLTICSVFDLMPHTLVADPGGVTTQEAPIPVAKRRRVDPELGAIISALLDISAEVEEVTLQANGFGPETTYSPSSHRYSFPELPSQLGVEGSDRQPETTVQQQLTLNPMQCLLLMTSDQQKVILRRSRCFMSRPSPSGASPLLRWVLKNVTLDIIVRTPLPE